MLTTTRVLSFFYNMNILKKSIIIIGHRTLFVKVHTCKVLLLYCKERKKKKMMIVITIIIIICEQISRTSLIQLPTSLFVLPAHTKRSLVVNRLFAARCYIAHKLINIETTCGDNSRFLIYAKCRCLKQ